LFVGSIFLVTTPTGQPAVNPVLAAVTSVLVGGFVTVIARRLLDAMAQPVSRIDKVIGQVGEARTDILREGSVYVGGENWSAHSRSFIPSGSTVVVKSQDGLVIEVELKS
jgi:membrane-bound ClpP family serine protease